MESHASGRGVGAGGERAHAGGVGAAAVFTSVKDIAVNPGSTVHAYAVDRLDGWLPCHRQIRSVDLAVARAAHTLAGSGARERSGEGSYRGNSFSADRAGHGSDVADPKSTN